MGTPPSEAAQAAEAQAPAAGGPRDGPSLAALEAALQLQPESYEAFARLLPHAAADLGAASGASVEEELRALEIDPAVFYRDAAGRSTQRLGLRRFSPDDLDPLAGPGPREAPGGDPAALAALLGFEDEAPDGAAAAAAEAAGGAGAAALQGLNVPDGDDDFEIRLDALGETYGGRLGHATPEGLSARLQVDSLTDDGDEEDDFRGAVLAEGGAAAEEDGLEPFALDPEFDYDAVRGLSSRMAAPPVPGEGPAGAGAPAGGAGRADVAFDPAPRSEAVC